MALQILFIQILFILIQFLQIAFLKLVLSDFSGGIDFLRYWEWIKCHTELALSSVIKTLLAFSKDIIILIWFITEIRMNSLKLHEINCRLLSKMIRGSEYSETCLASGSMISTSTAVICSQSSQCTINLLLDVALKMATFHSPVKCRRILVMVISRFMLIILNFGWHVHFMLNQYS